LADCRIFETEQFSRDLEHDVSGQQTRIKRKLQAYVYPQVRKNPYFGKNVKKLREYTPETWRYRIGDHRFFCTTDDRGHVVYMITADTRGRAC